MLARLSSPDSFLPAVEEPTRRKVSAKEKAAIIVRLLLAEGSPLPITSLPEDMQAALAAQMGRMRRIDRKTLQSVVLEFLSELEEVGLSFPGGIEGALSMMDGHISTNAATRLRRLNGGNSTIDPWERLVNNSLDLLAEALKNESIEVVAIALSKLPVQKAAELLGKFPGDRARAVAYAVSQTGNIDPETVHRIGLSLAIQIDSQPIKAFDVDPGERVGAILNIAAAMTRDDVLKGLQETDASFAEIVRKSIFTFEHISARLAPRDVPKLVRILDQQQLVTALAAAENNPEQSPSADHILANLSQRMAMSLKEEVAGRGKIKDKDAEEAMTAIVTAIRQLEGAGEVVLVTPEE
ncbi:MAG: FliG C-terminal domain-containing protein [bacterium]